MSMLCNDTPERNMTDKELLEAAARAAGYKIKSLWERYTGEWWAELHVDRKPNDPPTVWSPLTDDGDALRLANALRLSLEYTDHYVATNPAQTAPKHFAEPLTHGTNEAARRAIVRAAAEIGSLHNAEITAAKRAG